MRPLTQDERDLLVKWARELRDAIGSADDTTMPDLDDAQSLAVSIRDLIEEIRDDAGAA